MKKELLNCVVISNEFARNSQINLNCNEWKLLLYLISRIKKHERVFMKEKITVREVCELWDISTFQIIRKSVEMLEKCVVKIGADEIKMFEFIKADKKHIIYKFSNDMGKHLLGLENNMTIFDLGYIYSLNSKYAIRLYLFALSFRHLSYYHISVENFKELFESDCYKSEFERRVINKSIELINKVTNIILHSKCENNRYYFALREKSKTQKRKYNVDSWKDKIITIPNCEERAKKFFDGINFDDF
ncbi:MAG: replication initiation protein [Clostridia bacterium]|nr:replication initiation protein [Clostridia bacterium]